MGFKFSIHEYWERSEGKERKSVMFWGTIIRLIIGASLSYNFILPTDLWNLKLAAMTIGDILRILGALVATLGAGGIGLLIDTLRSD